MTCARTSVVRLAKSFWVIPMGVGVGPRPPRVLGVLCGRCALAIRRPVGVGDSGSDPVEHLIQLSPAAWLTHHEFDIPAVFVLRTLVFTIHSSKRGGLHRVHDADGPSVIDGLIASAHWHCAAARKNGGRTQAQRRSDIYVVIESGASLSPGSCARNPERHSSGAMDWDKKAHARTGSWQSPGFHWKSHIHQRVQHVSALRASPIAAPYAAWSLLHLCGWNVLHNFGEASRRTLPPTSTECPGFADETNWMIGSGPKDHTMLALARFCSSLHTKKFCVFGPSSNACFVRGVGTHLRWDSAEGGCSPYFSGSATPLPL